MSKTIKVKRGEDGKVKIVTTVEIPRDPIIEESEVDYEALEKRIIDIDDSIARLEEEKKSVQATLKEADKEVKKLPKK